MPLILPESAYIARVNAEIASQVDDQTAEASRWNRQLRTIDERLSLVWVYPEAEDSELIAGRWAIRWRFPGAPDEFITLQGPSGQFRHPGAWMLDMLNENDLWASCRRHEREVIRRRLREAKERAHQTEKEQRFDEASYAMRAAKRLRGPEGFTKTSARKRRGDGLKRKEGDSDVFA